MGWVGAGLGTLKLFLIMETVQVKQTSLDSGTAQIENSIPRYHRWRNKCPLTANKVIPSANGSS